MISLEQKINHKIDGGGGGISSSNKRKDARDAVSSTPSWTNPNSRDAYGRTRVFQPRSTDAATSTPCPAPTPSFLKVPTHQNTSAIAYSTTTTATAAAIGTVTKNRKIATIRPTMTNPYKTPRAAYSKQPTSSRRRTGYTSNRKRTINTPRSALSTPYSYANNINNNYIHTPADDHIICAISENLARETCIATMNPTRSPTHLQVTKQGNGQTYAETLAYLEYLNPHEIILNEGRRHSKLAQKMLALFGDSGGNSGMMGLCDGGGTKKKQRRGTKKKDGNDHNNNDDDISKTVQQRKRQFTSNTKQKNNGRDPNNKSITRDDSNDARDTLPSPIPLPRHQTIVKFVPRTYFDQTRGADLLRRITREGTYDPSVVEEYILLSASHAILQYTQACLGINFHRDTLELELNWGGKNRMTIDRCTLVHLELLANAKTGKSSNSLIGTVDLTKTSVGSRLLRTNLMAPPTRVDTIKARLDLVDTFLDDEDFFYEVMEQLEALPEIDKMLAHMALVPRPGNVGGNRKASSAGSGGGQKQVTARMASTGISALVCIKTTLSVIPNFARVLEMHLKSLAKQESKDKKEATKDNGDIASLNGGGKDDTESNNDETTCTGQEKETEDSDSLTDDEMSACTTVTNGSSLLLGLGGGPASCGEPYGRYQLLRAILLTMKQPDLKKILEAVLDIFTESTTHIRNSHAMRHQECFALKPNTDGMMDVLRKAFLANVDDIYRLADEYAETYGFTVVVKETTARGYYLAIPATLSATLPQIFIQPVKTGRFINCTTEEVHSLNARAQENVQDLLLMTHERIQEVIAGARDKFDALASLSDAIALLDMCHCFADNVASSRLPWCRPVVTDCDQNSSLQDSTGNSDGAAAVGGSNAIAIRNGRYAIDVSSTGLMTSNGSSPAGEYIPNDTYASANQNLTIITGINGSGKSTYLKQIAMTVVLAHCGSYVPAEEAFIPIRDRLCTRIGTSDDQEHNISTFMQEMKETAFICRNATDRSLILIDELGRATSNEDGVAIAWAAAEYLLVKRAMTFFATHYPQVSKMADIYPNVQNQHLGAIAGCEGVRYMHKILPGPCRMAADYGVEMAASCGWQEDVVNVARSIRAQVQNKLPDGVLCQRGNPESDVDTIALRKRAESMLVELVKHLTALKECEGRLDDSARKPYLQDLREQFISDDADPNLIQMIKDLLLEDDNIAIPTLPLQPEGLNGAITSPNAPMLDNNKELNVRDSVIEIDDGSTKKSPPREANSCTVVASIDSISTSVVGFNGDRDDADCMDKDDDSSIHYSESYNSIAAILDNTKSERIQVNNSSEEISSIAAREVVEQCPTITQLSPQEKVLALRSEDNTRFVVQQSASQNNNVGMEGPLQTHILGGPHSPKSSSGQLSSSSSTEGSKAADCDDNNHNDDDESSVSSSSSSSTRGSSLSSSGSSSTGSSSSSSGNLSTAGMHSSSSTTSCGDSSSSSSSSSENDDTDEDVLVD